MWAIVVAALVIGGASASEAGCQAGDVAACRAAAEPLRRMSVAEGGARLFAVASRGCELGAAELCATASHARRDGWPGVTKDLAAALRFAQRGCDLGAGSGCEALGWLYENGLGVTADAARAMAWFEKGCAGGDKYACSGVGRLYERGGVGLVIDRSKAWEGWKRSCELGFDDACYRAGKNRLAAGDKVTARVMFDKGCKLSYRLACDERDRLDGKQVIQDLGYY